MRRIALVPCLALLLGSRAVAVERDLATQPADCTITARSVPGLMGPSTASDFDGDGLTDLALHGWVWRSERLREGATDLFARTKLVGAGAGPIDVADLDGDGQLDLVAAIPFSSSSVPNFFTEGRVVVFFGPGPRPDPANLSGDYPQGDWTLIGAGDTSFLGERLAVGDFNGDGVSDIVAGGIGYSFYLSVGKAFGIAGPISRGTTLDLASQAPTFRLATTESAGYGIALGDMDGDGTDDLALSGQNGVRVFRGSRLAGDVDWNAPDLEVRYPPGLIDADDLGDIPVLLRDLGGDGRAELVLGIGGGTGRVYVVRGRSPLPAMIDLGAGGADAVVVGAACCVHLGSAIAIADWTGDGVIDLVVGAPGTAGPDGTRTDAGAVVVVPDAPALAGTIDLATTPPVMTIHGAVAGDRFGKGFHGRGLVAADFNGDGRVDIAAEAPRDRPADALLPTTSGSVHVLYGTPQVFADVLHSIGDPAALSVVASGVSSPWDSSPGLLADGALHFFALSDPPGGESVVFVTPQVASSTVRLSWTDGAASTVPVDPIRSSVSVLTACAAPDGRSVVTLLATPRDASGDRLGAGLDVRPDSVASWLPAVPDGGFRDLGNGTYALEVPAAAEGLSAMRVQVEGVTLADVGNATFALGAPDVMLTPSTRTTRVGSEVTFTTTVTSGAPPYSWSSDLDGDGSIDSTVGSPSFAFSRAGVFAVVVDVEDSMGCVRRAIASVAVSP